MFKQLFCDHDFVEMSKTETLSPYETIVKSGQELKNCDNIASVFKKIFIYVFKCKKCDKVVMRVVDSRGEITSSVDVS